MSSVSRRRYDSSGRQAASARNQAAVVASAGRLMLEQGYAATTVGDVADDAGVSSAFVYSAFGTKAGLLRRVIDAAIAGDDEPRSVGEREEAQAVREARSARRRCELTAALVVGIQARTAPYVPLVQQAAGSDAEIAQSLAAQDLGRRHGMLELVGILAADDQLREGLSNDEAADVAWVLTDPAAYNRLVEQRGWTRDAFTAWLAHALYDNLCRKR